MMICSTCGYPLGENHKFCANCGCGNITESKAENTDENIVGNDIENIENNSAFAETTIAEQEAAELTKETSAFDIINEMSDNAVQNHSLNSFSSDEPPPPPTQTVPIIPQQQQFAQPQPLRQQMPPPTPYGQPQNHTIQPIDYRPENELPDKVFFGKGAFIFMLFLLFSITSTAVTFAVLYLNTLAK